MSAPNDRRVVYSTGIGRIRYCARCGQPEDRCQCKTKTQRAQSGSERPGMPRDGIVRVARDRKGRGGKTVTIITGLPDDATLTSIAQTLKRFCGSGGTVKDGVVEIQGDHRDRLQARLVEMGYNVKVAGG